MERFAKQSSSVVVAKYLGFVVSLSMTAMLPEDVRASFLCVPSSGMTEFYDHQSSWCCIF